MSVTRRRGEGRTVSRELVTMSPNNLEQRSKKETSVVQFEPQIKELD
jgi:hypothetical protein